MPFKSQIFFIFNELSTSTTTTTTTAAPTLSLVTSSQTSGATLTIPTGATAGDLAIFACMQRRSGFSPSGASGVSTWSLLNDTTGDNNVNVSWRAQVFAKSLSASDPGTNLTLPSNPPNTTWRFGMILIFRRSDRAGTSISNTGQVSGWTYETTLSDQTISNTFTAATDLIVFYGHCFDSSSTALSVSDGALSDINFSKLEYKIYNGNGASSLSNSNANWSSFRMSQGGVVRLN